MTEKKSYPEEIYEWRQKKYEGYTRSKLPHQEALETAERVNRRAVTSTSELRFPEDLLSIGETAGGERVPANLFDVAFEYSEISGTLRATGSGGSIVIDRSNCMVDVARVFLDFAKGESCGECTYCRIGTTRMSEIMERICGGQGLSEDADELEELAQKISTTCLCEIGKIASAPVLATLAHFGREYAEHIGDVTCRAGKCGMDSKG
ncbi:MAG: hypothetical protein GY762_21940 [Proteobacteria bacterium]|nr:hypothetical protein [Pseudomonadota bacterium]